MKAVICTKYGPPEVLQIKEVEKPVPKDNEVLIKIFTVVVGIEDPMQRKGKPYFVRAFVGLTKPGKPILGTEFCGEIEAVGKNVTLFKTGDHVFGATGFGFCCYAEYMCMPEAGFLSIKPPNMTSEEAAPVCGALAAWNFLKVIANIRKGQKVLIHGASGSIGSAAVQIAGILGTEVTGVCSSSDEDFTKNGLTYDVILELTGRLSFSQCKTSLNRNGFFLTTYPTISTLFQMLWTSMFNGKKVIFSATGLKPVSERLEFLEELIKLFKEGKLKTIIDQRFPLEKMVEAHRYVEQGHIKGNVVVNVTHDN